LKKSHLDRSTTPYRWVGTAPITSRSVLHRRGEGGHSAANFPTQAESHLSKREPSTGKRPEGREPGGNEGNVDLPMRVKGGHPTG